LKRALGEVYSFNLIRSKIQYYNTRFLFMTINFCFLQNFEAVHALNVSIVCMQIQ
jgi:hypothetical protein